jgi:SAM-dependent methyltransferase
MTPPPLPESAIWHDVECGSYVADLPVWRELAARADGAVLDVGAGTGRVTLDLARRGHEVTALDREAALLAVLRERARGLPAETVAADARDFRLGRRFALCVVPMQTIQLLGGRDGRRRFLETARDHLTTGALLAAAIAEDLMPFEAADPAIRPPPDVHERDGWVYASQPVATRQRDGITELERVREAVSPDGARTSQRDVVRLDRLTARQLQREAGKAGFDVLPATSISATAEHVGSRVVMLRA